MIELSMSEKGKTKSRNDSKVANFLKNTSGADLNFALSGDASCALYLLLNPARDSSDKHNGLDSVHEQGDFRLNKSATMTILTCHTSGFSVIKK